MCSSSPPGSQSFPKSRRLRKRVEYQRVYEQGVRLRGACFAVFCRRSDAPGPGRVGFSVPKRIGGAVVRGRIRRRLRELVRQHWSELPDHCEIVFHVYPAVLGATAAELEDQVARAFRESARALQSNGSPRRRPPDSKRG